MAKDMWTQHRRNAFIDFALKSVEEKGMDGRYGFNVLPKVNNPVEIEDERRNKVTSAFMNTIFSNPEYRIIALKLYEILIDKIRNNPNTAMHYNKNIMVVMKGSTAYTYLVKRVDDVFNYSDLDIVIYINPNLTKLVFDSLKYALNTIVLQTISQYKRTIDLMFFLDDYNNETFLPPHIIRKFKQDYQNALSALDNETGRFVSPFPMDGKCEYRNLASKNSFIIANSKVKDDTVVRVEVPHFEWCECIPLRRTPMFCSHNRTLDFNRVQGKEDGTVMKGQFDLYRIRLNTLYVPREQSRENFIQKENIVADFIDISIAAREDCELAEFWEHGQCMLVRDDATNIWISIPDGWTCMADLHKMLNVYECTEAKREKRQRRYCALKEFVESINNM